MSSEKSVSPLTLSPEPSRILKSILLITHLGGAALLWPLDLSWTAKLVLWLMLTVSLVASWPRRGGNGVRRLVWQADDDWLLQMPDGSEVDARLLPGSYCHPWLVVLNFQIADSRRRRSVVLFADALAPDMRRRLRARLGLSRPER